LFFNYNGQGSLSEFRDKYPFIDWIWLKNIQNLILIIGI
jgi:hypothetical protein